MWVLLVEGPLNVKTGLDAAQIPLCVCFPVCSHVFSEWVWGSFFILFYFFCCAACSTWTAASGRVLGTGPQAEPNSQSAVVSLGTPPMHRSRSDSHSAQQDERRRWENCLKVRRLKSTSTSALRNHEGFQVCAYRKAIRFLLNVGSFCLSLLFQHLPALPFILLTPVF